MGRSVTISSGLIPVAGKATPVPGPGGAVPRYPLRSAAMMAAVLAAFSVVGVQLVRLAGQGAGVPVAAISAPIATGTSRPDLVDRSGRLLAGDVELPSLFVDPLLVVDRDELVEKLRGVLPDLDEPGLRSALAEKGRRFHWVKRGLSPALAQRVHNLGLPGLAFRQELRRAYPGGHLAGHVLGGVNVDNRAVAGIERYLDEAQLVDPVVSVEPSSRVPVQLSLDMRVQHALEQELIEAKRTYRAQGAGGVVLDVETGEVIASSSLPFVDPSRLDQTMAGGVIDRIAGGTYELGSIFKLMTVAMALDSGRVTANTVLDLSQPLSAGRFEFKDHHGGARAMSVRDVFLKSSNVGAGTLALNEGTKRQKAFLASLGLADQIRTEAGPVAGPVVPGNWDRAETITVSFGHGIAVAPLQFAAAAAALVNGGEYVAPTLLKRPAGAVVERRRVISEKTSAALREMMRANVAERGGTGERAATPGFAVGGKTGTAEIAVRGRYDRNAVIASFLAAFPIEKPRYVTLVMLFRPARTAASGGEITASRTAAPATRRLVGRIAPLLGLKPDATANGS
ncbi:MAG: penicillin-binding protein 2 [Hyphomicrobiaceae bacterium]|nr:penicillin-binding protein 2 [Hyphomicrobiaceae bacterium]